VSPAQRPSRSLVGIGHRFGRVRGSPFGEVGKGRDSMGLGLEREAVVVIVVDCLGLEGVVLLLLSR
jgi:hypothetical protein